LFLLLKNKGWLHSAPEQLLAGRIQYRVRSSAAPATGARRSGRHDINLDTGNCSSRSHTEAL
jgi:hypothetical protein